MIQMRILGPDTTRPSPPTLHLLSNHPPYRASSWPGNKAILLRKPSEQNHPVGGSTGTWHGWDTAVATVLGEAVHTAGSAVLHWPQHPDDHIHWSTDWVACWVCCGLLAVCVKCVRPFYALPPLSQHSLNFMVQAVDPIVFASFYLWC